MSAYLDAADDDPSVSRAGERETQPGTSPASCDCGASHAHVAAHDQKLLGAHTYLVSLEHTRRAPEIMEPDTPVIPDQKFELTADSAEDRTRTKAALSTRHAELRRQSPLG
jgi:hypothetical protein